MLTRLCSVALQLLDVGTCPLAGSIPKLIEAMEENHQVGGVCGEIAARSPRWTNFVESAQHFEYKMSHVLDKCTCTRTLLTALTVADCTDCTDCTDCR